MKKKRKCQDITHWAWIAAIKFEEDYHEYTNIFKRMKSKFGTLPTLKEIQKARNVLKIIS